MFKLLITPDELAANIASPDFLVFDVRHDLGDHDAGRRAYQKGHIPGALFLDHETQLAAPRTGRNGRHPLPERQEFAELMRSYGLTPNKQVVVYDSGNSMFAAHLWWMMRWLGHESVAVLDGGWQAWVAAGGESMEATSSAAESGGQMLAKEMLSAACMPVVAAQDIEANIQQPTLTVLDARAANRYRGEVEPMDPVAGHIPGALNRPNTLNLDENGYFKSPAQLRSEFDALLEGKAPETIVHQCGSGITACHNLFAMELAGLHGSRLYPGSWSEWCSDPERPVAKG